MWAGISPVAVERGPFRLGFRRVLCFNSAEQGQDVGDFRLNLFTESAAKLLKRLAVN